MESREGSGRPLEGRVAVVTGATRGAGRGIALELGEAGATVYVTGRSTRQERTAAYDGALAQLGLEALPGTVEDTAEAVTRRGGCGVPVRCDHTREDEVRALFARVEQEAGRVDILVNNAWGAHEDPSFLGGAPFWELSMAHWDTMFDRGVRNHFLSSCCAAPLLVRQGRGLIITTTFWDRGRYVGNLFYDCAKAAMNRLAFALAHELGPHGITSVALSPGWMRTELVLAGERADEDTWRERPCLALTESVAYVGRAVVALATDPDVMARSGTILRVGDLAWECGFTDADGRWIPPFELEE